MFWGLVLEPGKRYAQTVDTAFHVSMACLEAKQMDNELTSVILDHNDREFILCSLHRQKCLQSQLDLNFSAGEKISFLTSGQGKVHLTGYLIEQDEDDDEDFELPEGAESFPSLSAQLADKLSASAKRKKKQSSPKEDKKKLKVSKADDDDDDESDFPSSDLEEDEDLVVADSDDDEEDEDDDDVEEEEDSDEDGSAEVQPLTGSSPFSTAGSTPFHKKQEGKEKLKTPNLQKGLKSPKPTSESNQKKDKTPISGNFNGTPEQKSGKKKKNKNKGTDSAANTPVQAKTPLSNTTPAKTPKQTLTGGVLIEETKVGNGPVAKQGSYVSVYYSGRLKQNNKQFDSVKEGNGFKFRLGGNEVIRGWDIGIPGMKVGGKRRIVIPPQMAYGQKGSLPAIPPNSTLIFEVELRNVK